jgi:hypothetical protein
MAFIRDCAYKKTPNRATTHSHVVMDSVRTVAFLNLATAEVTLLAETQHPAAMGITISPDEEIVLYTQTEGFGSDLMLVENFR